MTCLSKMLGDLCCFNKRRKAGVDLSQKLKEKLRDRRSLVMRGLFHPLRSFWIMEPGAAYWCTLDIDTFPEDYDPRETDLYSLMFLIFGLLMGSLHYDFASVSEIQELMKGQEEYNLDLFWANYEQAVMLPLKEVIARFENHRIWDFCRIILERTTASHPLEKKIAAYLDLYNNRVEYCSGDLIEV